jgi:transposase
MTLVSLSGTERATLRSLLRSSSKVQHLTRAQALLWLDDGDSAEEVADRLSVSRQTVYNWVSRFLERSHDAVASRIADAARSGRPPTALNLIDPLINEVIDTDPRQLGYRSTIWTTTLLQEHLLTRHQIDVSIKSVARALVRLDISWKLPRHTLAHREWYWRQAKGGSNAGSGAGTTPSS